MHPLSIPTIFGDLRSVQSSPLLFSLPFVYALAYDFSSVLAGSRDCFKEGKSPCPANMTMPPEPMSGLFGALEI